MKIEKMTVITLTVEEMEVLEAALSWTLYDRRSNVEFEQVVDPAGQLVLDHIYEGL